LADEYTLVGRLRRLHGVLLRPLLLPLLGLRWISKWKKERIADHIPALAAESSGSMQGRCTFETRTEDSSRVDVFAAGE
jgi:hypothetical protein